MTETCKLCESGNLHEIEEIEIIDNKKSMLLYSVCDYCGSEQADSIQVMKNKLSFLELRKNKE